MDHREFKCDVSESLIEYRCAIDKSEIFMEYTVIDSNIPKSFFLLVRKSFDIFISEGYKKFVQAVPLEEWEQFLKSNDKWTLRRIENTENHNGKFKFAIIECDINDAVGCIGSGLGFVN